MVDYGIISRLEPDFCLDGINGIEDGYIWWILGLLQNFDLDSNGIYGITTMGNGS